MTDIQAGDLKHKVIIMHNTSDGTKKPVWENLFEGFLHAAKQGLSEKLFYEAAAENSVDYATFIIRFSQIRMIEIKPTMKLIEDGDTQHPYEIIGSPVDLHDNRKWLKIHAKRVRINGS